MVFYICLLICITIFSYCYSKGKDINGLIICKTSVFLLLFLPAALRYGNGKDYFNYINIYNYIKKYGYFEDIEIGFNYLNKFCIALDLDVQWIFAIIAFFTTFFLFLSVEKRSFFIVIPIYYTMFYLYTFNIIRQCLVITMGYYAFQLFNKNKYARSIAIVVIGGLFHISSFVYILLFLCTKIFYPGKKETFALLLLVIILSVFNYMIIDFLFTYVLANTIYGSYGSTVYRNIVNERGSGLTLISTHIISIALLVFIPVKKNEIASSTLILFLFWYFFNLMAQSLSIFGRASVLFIIGWFQMLHLVNVNSLKHRKIALLVVFLWASALFTRQLTITYDTTFKTPYTLVPYRTIFEK